MENKGIMLLSQSMLCCLFLVPVCVAGSFIVQTKIINLHSQFQLTKSALQCFDVFGGQHKDNRKSILEKSGHVLYQKSVFSKEELSTIRKEVATYMNELQDESSSSIAQKRRGAAISDTSPVHSILQSGSLHRLVEKSTGRNCQLSPTIPVEIRVYDQPGASMAWHVDDVLYDPFPQIEVVWTLENDSDCQTRWKDFFNHDIVHNVETEPNSAILLTAGFATHCVTSLKYGRRVILKFAYVEEGSTFQEGIHKNQFDNRDTKKNRTRRARKR